jgi:hypothetical protein
MPRTPIDGAGHCRAPPPNMGGRNCSIHSRPDPYDTDTKVQNNAETITATADYFSKSDHFITSISKKIED